MRELAQYPDVSINLDRLGIHFIGLSF